MTAARRAFAVALLAWGCASGLALARPEPGRHAAEFCVATLPKPASCGRVQAELGKNGLLRFRIDDVRYTLQLHSSQLDVVVMHNVVQIDEFTANSDWRGETLTFLDVDRNSRYEIRFAPAAKR
ncbi:MAG: hypothetical protein Q7T55_07645 [Solirubrobacteraceae bacterium]|nr:hypothetical protein [Solirubrobacteraceae bacterium]